jgi:hypothetical protein
MDIRANPGCLNPLCVRLQAAYKVRLEHSCFLQLQCIQA